MRLEVRCCCDAHLIGWVELPRVPRAWSFVTLMLRPVWDGQPFDPDAPPAREDRLTFELAEIVAPLPNRERSTYLALKSHDYPLEQLRRIPSFREATPAEIEAAR